MRNFKVITLLTTTLLGLMASTYALGNNIGDTPFTTKENLESATVTVSSLSIGGTKYANLMSFEKSGRLYICMTQYSKAIQWIDSFIAAKGEYNTDPDLFDGSSYSLNKDGDSLTVSAHNTIVLVAQDPRLESVPTFTGNTSCIAQ